MTTNKWKLGRINELCPGGESGFVRESESDDDIDNFSKHTDAMTIIEEPVHSVTLLLECSTQHSQGSWTDKPN